MKPIVRWTIANVHKIGFDALNKSVRSFVKIYRDKYETVICYNNLSVENVNKLPKVDRLVDQFDFKDSYPTSVPGSNPAWKIYPARLNINVQEVFIDNDVIIYKEIPELELLDTIVISESITRSYSGVLKDQVTIEVNTGLFSLPPNFNFENKLINLINEFNIKWKDHLDEQTLLAFIIQQEKHHILTLEDIYVCCDKYQLGKYGVHFVGMNKGKKIFWDRFRSSFL